MGESMADNIAIAVARKSGQPIACALYFHGGDTLYGRYWGCAAYCPPHLATLFSLSNSMRRFMYS
jgi:predicted N-acyltransferase